MISPKNLMKLKKYILWYLLQSKLFVDDSREELKDNDIKELSKKSKHSWRSVRKSIDKLREIGILTQISQRPLIHEISEDYLGKLKNKSKKTNET